MNSTEWDSYGTGQYEKCANCMVHCGYEGTAVTDTVKHPLKALRVFMKGIRTDGPMVPDISLANQRPAVYVFEDLVRQRAQAASETKVGSTKRSDAA